jgi:Fuc2NAc and GlcNAc transferase
MIFWWLFPTVAGISLLLTGAVRRYALARNVMDVPNERSSHKVPTPRGGGVAIVLTFLAALPVLALYGLLAWPSMWALLGTGAGVAFMGFLDDHGHIAAHWRLFGHFAAAIWALFWLGTLRALPLPGHAVDLGWMGYVIAAVYLVWLLNLFNFMDGIDGIASIETVTVCLGGALLVFVAVPDRTLWITPVLLAAAVVGFLFWNYPPAKIFMGDAGSGFLGITMGVLSLQAATVVPNLFWAWVILLGAFIVDATVTLCRRVLRGEKPSEAHRSHAYQHASRKLGAHKPVSIVFGLINLLWLLPLALCVTLNLLDGLIGTVIAYTPLLMAAFYFKAGTVEACD